MDLFSWLKRKFLNGLHVFKQWLLMFFCCAPGSSAQADASQVEASRDIERQIRKEKKKLRQEVRILLLGSGESGKSTFIKQMVIIHGAGEFTADEVRAYRQQIYQNVISAMRVLVDASRKLGNEFGNRSLEKRLPTLLNITVSDLLRGIDHSTFKEVAPLIRDLWADPGIKQTFEQRNLFQITDSCQYFFNNLGRVEAHDFQPTNKDILFCRKATRGITEHTFEINRIPFKFIDVGGQRSQRQKWFQCFTDITTILFMVASNEYDQVILEDRKTNRVVESRAVFETIVNNQAFHNVSVILFMNKSDLLIEKVPKSDIRNYFSDFQGDHRNVRDVQYFLVDKFERSRKERHRPFFYHFTTAVDTENMRRVFRDVREVILKQNIEQLNMQ